MTCFRPLNSASPAFRKDHPIAQIVATNETILVVGGRISGMTAALEAAERGKDVILVEKSPSLDGNIIRARKLEEIAAKPLRK